MYEDNFCISDYPEYSYRLRVKVVYNLKVDMQYAFERWKENSVQYICVLTLEGAGKIETKNGAVSVRQGEMFVCRSSDMIRYKCMTKSWNFWWFEFDAEYLPVKLGVINKLSPENYFIDYCINCLELMKRRREQAASAVFTSLFHLWQCGIEGVGPNSMYISNYQMAIQYMKNNLSDFSIAELSKHLSISERTLRNIFYREVGISPVKTYHLIRMQAAEIMLRSNMSIFEISNSLGYSNQFHFSKAFREAFGISPSKYRQTKYQGSQISDKLEERS